MVLVPDTARRAISVAVALLVLGAVVVAVLLRWGGETEPATDDSQSPAVTDDFLAAFRRSLEATFALEGEFTRTMADGRTLRSGLLIAQRPPDQIRRQLGGASGYLGGRALNCSTTPTGEFSCAKGADAPPYRDEVDRQMKILSSYFDPATPVYRLTQPSPGCFRLELSRELDDPPYGEFSNMCFDDATGAMSSLELYRADGSVDRINAVMIRMPTELDFAVTRNSAFDQTNDELQGAMTETSTVETNPTVESAPPTGQTSEHPSGR